MTSVVASGRAAGCARPAARRSSPTVADVAIAGTALVISLALATRHASAVRPGPQSLGWLSGLLIVATTAPIVAWRRAPCAVFIVTAAVSVLMGALGDSLGLLVGPAAALYLWVASRDRTHVWTRRDTELVLALFAAYLAASAVGDRSLPGIELLHTGLAFGAAWFAGERTRLRREHLAGLEERAIRAEADADRDRRLALAEERARIARDLHDSVGHAMNVITIRAGAARLRHDTDPRRSYDALEAIETLARDTAGEIDQIVGALRDRAAPGDDDAAPLGLASVPDLVGHHATAGLEIEVVTLGAVRHIDPAVDAAAYRILQEALTNAARHGSSPVHVTVSYGETALRLEIVNRTRTVDESPTIEDGHGLIGMTERAELLGGTLTTRTPNGRFQVDAHLPYRCRHR